MYLGRFAIGFVVIAVAIIAAIIVFGGEAAEIDELLPLAEDRPTFVFFYSDACSNCEEMRVVVNDLQAGYSGRVAFLYIDMTSEDGEKAFNRLGLPAAPSFTILNPNGSESFRSYGMVSRGRLENAIANTLLEAPSVDDVVLALAQDRPTFVFFFRQDCANCEEMREVVNDLQSEYGDQMAFQYIDAQGTENGEAVFNQLGLPSQPSFVIFQPDGDESFRTYGMVSRQILESAIRRAS